MSSLPKPQYTIWQAVSAALALAMRAVEEVRALSRLPGPKGDPGEVGLGFDDLTCSLEDGGRVLVLKFSSGERSKEFRLNTGMAIYRGVFKDGQTYENGDIVTWGGSTWHCNSETPDKPGDGSKSWTLAVKKGRDGRDGKDGEKGERGPEGKQGRDRY